MGATGSRDAEAARATLARNSSRCSTKQTTARRAAEGCAAGTRRKQGYAHERPRWLDDGLVEACGMCRVKFTFTLRRHHCRSCGLIFCAKCTRMQDVRYLGYDRPQRQCLRCEKQLRQQRGHRMSALILPCVDLITPLREPSPVEEPVPYERQTTLYRQSTASSGTSKTRSLGTDFSESTCSVSVDVLTSASPTTSSPEGASHDADDFDLSPAHRSRDATSAPPVDAPGRLSPSVQKSIILRELALLSVT